MKKALFVFCILASVSLFLPSTEAAPILFDADLNGLIEFSPNGSLNGLIEFSPNGSPGAGYALVGIDTVPHTMYAEVAFSGLEGTTTVAQIHAPTVVAGGGVRGFLTPFPELSKMLLLGCGLGGLVGYRRRKRMM
jgi:hypothetical protein